jgi:hypothetical protein
MPDVEEVFRWRHRNWLPTPASPIGSRIISGGDVETRR